MGDHAGLRLIPVGRVSRGHPRGVVDEHWEQAESEIEIDGAWVDALDGIEGFSHLWVLWLFDEVAGAPEALRIHPERRQELPLVGLFATRSPVRPNPIALTAVRLLGRDGARLIVAGLDAFEGSLVLDLKPYLLRGDQIAQVEQPEWLVRLWSER
jgi:tRNA-Thr(GGU) m(6)t(6)A37 methyltransferase TsaA